MKKDAKAVVKKLNWKGWTLIFAIAVLVGILIYSFFIVCFQTWLLSILFPVILSGVASIGVSLWFTAKTEKDNIYRDLFYELHEIFDYCYQLSKSLDSTFSNITLPVLAKKRIMINDIARKPRMFNIQRHYKEYYEFFVNKRKELVELVGSIETGNNQFVAAVSDSFYFEYVFKTTEITEETLKLQEQILQDFKRIPKGPIKDQLIFRMNSNQDKSYT